MSENTWLKRKIDIYLEEWKNNPNKKPIGATKNKVVKKIDMI